MRENKLLSLILAGLLAMLMVTPAFGAEVGKLTGNEIHEPGGSAGVPIVLDAEAASFSVTIPTVLPVKMAADGTITVADENKIINNSTGSVEVVSVTIEPVNTWSLVEMTSDFKAMRVGSKNFGFCLQEIDVPAMGICDVSNFEVIPGKRECNFTYDANVAPQYKDISETIANAVFVVAWAFVEIE